MNLLQRHIFKSVLFACVVSAAVFTFVLIAGNAFRDLFGYLVSGQLDGETFAKLIALLVPFVAVNALPIGMLTAVLLVLGRMSAQQEITAMRASGIGLTQVAKPILILALLGVVVSLGLNFYYGPQARTLYRVTVNDAVRKNPLSMIVEKTFIRDFPGVVVYVGEKKGGNVADVWIWKLDKQNRATEFIHARRGRIDYDDDTNVMHVTLSEAQGEKRDEDAPERFSNTDWLPAAGETSLDLPMGALFGTRTLTRKPNWLTLDELLARRKELEKKGASLADQMKVAMAINDKASGALTILAFTVMAIPLGIKVSRKETSANLGVALLLALTFYFMNTAVGWLENLPRLRPDLLLWVPPLLFIGLGIWMFRRVERI